MSDLKIDELIAAAHNEGFRGDNAAAKVCQDLILKAISKSRLSRSVTIKGGVVMRSLSGSARRATLDIDIDFLHYPIEDSAIDAFIESLNCLYGVTFSRFGTIEELNQQDYRGKRAYIRVRDASGTIIESKVDLGVHKDFDVVQEEYCFEVSCYDGAATLLVNSKEQMVAEKTKSLLRFGSRSTRFKDVFDIYYLIPYCDADVLLHCFEKYVFHDPTMRENNFADVTKRLSSTFSDSAYLSRLRTTNKNWLGVALETVLNGIVAYFNGL